MAYKGNKPEPTDQLKFSQADLQENFGDIQSSFDRNHVDLPLGAPSGQEGKHKWLDMPEQATLSVPTLANEGALYTLQGPTSAVTELAFRRESNGVQIPFTEGLNNASAGYTRLPSGLLIKWRRVNWPAFGGTSVQLFTENWPTAGIPAFTSLLFAYQTVSITQNTYDTSRNIPFSFLVGDQTNITQYRVGYVPNSLVSSLNETGAFTMIVIGIGT